MPQAPWSYCFFPPKHPDTLCVPRSYCYFPPKHLIHSLLSCDHSVSIVSFQLSVSVEHFWSCLSFGEECRSVHFGPNVISTMLLVTPRSISLGEHDPGSLTLVHGHHGKTEIGKQIGYSIQYRLFRPSLIYLNPIICLSFLYHTAFYRVPCNPLENDPFCSTILSKNVTHHFKG